MNNFLFNSSHFIFLSFVFWFYNIIETSCMEKWNISKRLFNKPFPVSGFKQQRRPVQPGQIYTSQRVMNEQSELSYQKTVKIINQPRKRFMGGYQKRNMVATQIDSLVQNDSSANQFNPKVLTKEKNKQPHGQQLNLKSILNQYRLTSLKNHLVSKLRKNSIFRIPVIFEPFQENPNESEIIREGIQLHKMLLNFAFAISITMTFCTIFLITLLFVFQDKFLSDSTFGLFQIFTILCQFCQILMGFVRVKQVGSRKLTKMKDISYHYLRSQFTIDILCLVVVFICLSVSSNDANYLLAVYFLKIPECVQRIVKIETKLFQSFYWEQYWGLLKLLFTNFLYAHFIAILILMMSWLDDDQSWMSVKLILNAPWYEQYAWAYYWSTTIMLTVGFGDIAAANYKQAICLVLIETVSCMALAYNINCIGNLLKQLNSKEVQKQKSLKILKKLCDNNQINSDLDFKLSNHIKQSYNIETKYNFEEQAQFVEKLPPNLKEDFLRTANYRILSNLPFIKNFTHKTISALAQNLQMKITHPDELLMSISDINRVIVLKQGQIGFFPNCFKSKYKKVLIDKFTVKEGGPSALISLDFLRLPIVRKYDIKSTVYSKVYFMQTQTMLTILKRKDVDRQFFQSIRDKQKIDLDDFETVFCCFCDCNHTKFRCPRLHYIPIPQQIIFKHLHQIKIAKNKRMKFLRKKQEQDCRKSYRKNKYISGTSFLFESGDQILIGSGLASSHSSRKRQRRLGRLSSIINDFQAQYEKPVAKQQSKEIKNKILLSAAELVQKQVIELFVDKKTQFWGVQSDEAKDYKFYFSKQNPKCLQNLQIKKMQFHAKSFSKLNSKIRCANNLKKTA